MCTTISTTFLEKPLWFACYLVTWKIIDWVSLMPSVTTLTPYALLSLSSPSPSLTLLRRLTPSSNVFGRCSITIVIVQGQCLISLVSLFQLE